MFLRRIRCTSRTKKVIHNEIKIAVDKIGGKIILFNYNDRAFGNIELCVEKDNTVYEFIVDRGEVICNHKMLCDNSYGRLEQKKPYQKLVEIIESCTWC